MSRASEAYTRLVNAMETTRPECLGNDRFTADDLDKAEKAKLAVICNTCPLAALCLEYAELDRPKAGLWAGKTYRNYKTKEEK